MAASDIAVSTAPGVFIAVVGPSGAGKDSILQAAARALSTRHDVLFVRRMITRPADGTEDHVAVDDAEFARLLASDAFAITWDAHGLRYGLPATLVDDLAAGCTVIANVSRTVIATLRERHRHVLVVSIEAPEHILAARLKARGREAATALARRLARSIEAVAADVRIENAGELADAVHKFRDIVMATSVPASQLPQARYAIYLAPAPSTPLWAVASDIVGYDAATGEARAGFAPAGMTHGQWRALTRAPAAYGFHATLKAPFRLAPHRTVVELLDALAAFCTGMRPVALGPLVVRSINWRGETGFVALIPAESPPELAELERAVVTRFDAFRAPLTPAEYQRRKPEQLPARQRQHLDTYGYPHVLDQFRCHFTLTGATENAQQLADPLERHFERACGNLNFTVDALVLFEQPAPDKPFRILRRFPFGTVA